MLRRLKLTVSVIDSSGAEVDRYVRHLQRHFGFQHGATTAPRRVLIRDDRIGTTNAPVRVTYRPKTVPPGGSVRYDLTYERVVGPPDERGDVLVDGAISVVAGELALD